MAESGESDFIPIFLPWYWMDKYHKEFKEPLVLSDEEQMLERIYGLTHTQLNWRRFKIAELSVGGSDGVKAFMQEYPLNAVEAFQTSGDDSFLTPSLVMVARKCSAERFGALVVGVDPARFGSDRTCIVRRQGRQAYGLESYVKKDTMEICGMVHRIIVDEQPTKVCIDIGGLGAGIYDRLIELGHRDIVAAINFGGTPLNQNRYVNKRSEMWGELREWLVEQPSQIPDSDELHADLCGVRYKFDSKDRLLMEKKEDMKKRGVRSSDAGDALALTFAMPRTALTDSRKKNDAETAKNVMSGFNRIDRLKKAAYRK